MKNKKNMRRFLSGFLAMLTVLSTILSPILSYAADVVPEEPPLYEKVKNELDADEVVKAKDLELETGSIFEVEKDFTRLEIPDEKKVKITFHEAKNEEKQDFTTDYEDTYKAVYYVEPVSGHPIYQINRKLIVKEAVVQVAESENQESVSNQEDENEAEGEEPAIGTAESEEPVQDEVNVEIPSEDKIYEEVTPTEIPVEEEPIDTPIPENPSEEVSTEEPAIDDNPDTDSTFEEITDTDPEEMPEATDDSFTDGTEKTEDADGNYQVNIVRGEEFHIELNHEDGQYQPGETVVFSGDMPQGSLIAVGTTKVQANQTENTEDLLYSEVTYHEESDKFSFEMPADDIDLSVSMDQAENGIMLLATDTPWDDATNIEANKYYYYSDGQLHPFDTVMGQGGNDSYKYVRYKAGGKTYTVNAYCMQHSMQSPPSGTTYKNMVELDEGGDDKYLRKALFYGYGGPGWGHTFNGYNVKSIMEKYGCSSETRAMQHYLVDYLYDGESGFGGALSTTAKNMLKEIKAALAKMPDPTAMKLLPGLSVNATGKETESFTWKANEAFTITIHLENGVSLVNETTGKTASGNVTVKGGEKFHLVATTANMGSLKGKYAITSNFPLDFHAMLLKLESSQDIGFGYYTDSADLQITVDWPEEAVIEITKKDGDTGKNLAGAVYGVYSDNACTKLIVKMPPTDSNGSSRVTLTKTQAKISFSHTFVNDRVSAAISLNKKDAETKENKAQGDASLENAVYGLYARNDITHPDGKTGVIYKAGSQIGTLTTDKEGKARIENLYLGEYYIKEITPSVGYLADEHEYDLVCSDEGDLTAVVEKECTSLETVKKQPFELIKAANNGDTDAALLSGAGFSAYLVSSLVVKEDGNYDFSSAEPVVIGENGATEIFTNEKGYVKSIAIPYGTYLVRETTTPHNYKPVDDFIVRITENKPTEPQTWRVLLDKEFSAKLKIIKQDDETKKSVLIPGTEFKIYDMDHEKYVEQVTTYPITVTHTSYFTDIDGYLILPQNLKIGHYRIEEVTAPDGYTINKNYVEIQVDTNTLYQTDPVSGDAVIEVVYEDHSVKGKLTVQKKGEVLSTYKNDFRYEVQNLSGAVYEVYAAEDIYTADFQKDDTGKRILKYAKGEKVAELTTDESGKAELDNLPLGEYKVVEKTAPEGFVLNEEEQKISFVYADQNTPVISQSAEFINDRQKVEVSVVKKDAENEKGLSGAEFGLYAKEDIKAGDKVLVKADELLTKAVTGEDGKTVFEQDLPFGTYYIKELAAPDGFVSSDEQIEVTAKYQGQEVKTVKLETVFKNEPTTTEFTKSDITTGVELDGATLTVLDSDGKEVEKWTSVKGKAHVIKRLHVGKTYTLREEFAPYGYLQAEEVKFTVSDTADVHKVEMKDAVPVGRIIINKKGEFVKEVTWKDMLAGGMDAAFGYVTGSLKDVTFEIYAAEDIKAADGESSDYYKKDELVATITTDALGYARSEDLPLGKYYVKEKETADGYVLDGEIREVDLTYRDQNTPVVTYDEDWQNNRQKAKVTVVKKEKNTDRVLEGGVFALYTKNDILNAEGEVILKADTMIEQKATDQDGRIVFTADLPINGNYYVKEVQAPAGFVTTEEIKEFDFAYAGEEVAEVSFEFTYEDEPTTFEITKSDITTGEELPGAKLKVSDSEGNVVDEWTSGSTPHIIKELEVGKKYTLTETIPADGYATAESITFVVENTADIQKVEMQDDTTKILISKVDMTDGSSEVKGAKLYILNENQEVMESWTSGDQPHYVEKLSVGTYTLLEETAPKGYIVANKVTFEVKDTGDVQGAKMEDEQAMGKVILNKTDKDTKKPMKGVEFALCDSKGKVLETLVTDSAGHAESKNYPIATFKNGQYKKAITYILKETKTLDGYQLDETEHKIQFEYVNDRTPVIEYTLDLTNKKAPEKDTPETSENQGVSTPGSHGSDATSVSNSPKTGDNTNIAIFVLALAVSAGCLGTVVTVKRKRK